MSDTPPIACTLHPSDAEERETEIRALGRDGLLGITRSERRVVLRFADDPGIRDRVTSIVAAESACCAFLTLALRDEAGTLAVTVTAPQGGEPILHELTGLFAADAEAVAT